MASDAPLEHPFPPSPQKRKPSADLVEAVRKKTGGVSMQHQDATDGGRELEEDDIDADGEDERGDAEENSVTQKLSERRQKQNDAFEDWLSNEAENIWEEDPAQKPGFVTDDTQASVRKIIAQAESTSIIDDPREYQLELFEKAKKENIIAVLDTGSGKTLIAVMLLKHLLDKELEARALGKPHQIAFFLVASVTLVFQQHAVLECNLDQKIEPLCGPMGCDLWNKEQWATIFAENMVIVCTAEILYQCLVHSFLTMKQISLLIFDEAHHTKKGHSYAKIIKDFYLPLGPNHRPRVFGMTASPIDAKTDVEQAASELEALLHSRIATTANLAQLQEAVAKPQEKIARYDRLERASLTSLCQSIAKIEGHDDDHFNNLVQYAALASSELGSWCADRFWSLSFADDDADRMERKLEHKIARAEGQGTRSAAELQRLLGVLRQMKAVIMTSELQPPTVSNKDLSSKVLKLCEYLTYHYTHDSNIKGIVFVQRRRTAIVLADLFTQLQIPNLRCGSLIGARGWDMGEITVTFRAQTLALMKFRKGELNCLFATSIAEEGLDIPDCNLVVRFDLYSTLIQYIQSRGRARHKSSHYIHMVESGNGDHMNAVGEAHKAEILLRAFCEKLPEDRKLRGLESDLRSAIGKGHTRVYQVPETGAKLTYNAALTILAHYLSCLPHVGESAPRPTYVMMSKDESHFVCEVVLPSNSPVTSAVGLSRTTKALAKRSAAFQACLELLKLGQLDQHLLPTIKKYLPAMRNAQLAIKTKRLTGYHMRTKPEHWDSGIGSTPSTLFATLIWLARIEDLSREYWPIMLLTRTKLPNFPSFPIFFLSGSNTDVCTLSLEKPLMMAGGESPSVLHQLTRFTLRIFHHLFNKDYQEDTDRMPYWLAPVALDLKYDATLLNAEPNSLLNHCALNEVANADKMPWSPASDPHTLINRFIVDQNDGGRRFYTQDVSCYTPSDPVPPGSAVAKRLRKDILDYSSSLYRIARENARFDMGQPVYQAEAILHRHNWLDKPNEKERKAARTCFICLEPLKISTIPVGVASMCYLFPAIIHRLDSYMISLDLTRSLHLPCITPALALEAVTKDSDNTDEHRLAQLSFQRGMGHNYERLEFIGDCFLKLATTISLYVNVPDHAEFEYHVRRMCMICNENLFKVAKDLNVPEFVRSQGFNRRRWYPAGMKLLKGKGAGKDEDGMTHGLGDKTVADVCEAIIGAALVSGREKADFDSAVRAVTTFVKNPDHSFDSFSEYFSAYKRPDYVNHDSSASILDLAEQIYSVHPYRFKYPRLLRSAFTHPSMPTSLEKIPNYQRLEFLGDALLDLCIVNYLYHDPRFANRDPQWLTEHKMAMVSNRFFSALAVQLGFHRHLRYMGAVIEGQNRTYVQALKEAESEAKLQAERAGAGMEKSWMNYWNSVSAAPKCLSDLIESYVGAIFVDSEFSMAVVESFFEMHIKPWFLDMSLYDTYASGNPITLVTTNLANTYGCENFRILMKEIPASPYSVRDGKVEDVGAKCVVAIMVHETVLAKGMGNTGGRYAKERACKQGLKALAEMTDGMDEGPERIRIFRQKYGCDCRKGETMLAAAG